MLRDPARKSQEQRDATVAKGPPPRKRSILLRGTALNLALAGRSAADEPAA